MSDQRVSKKDREEAARIAKEHGVRVTIGKFTIDGRDGTAANDDEGQRVQDKLDAMGAKR
jgi:hypothetical protein